MARSPIHLQGQALVQEGPETGQEVPPVTAFFVFRPSPSHCPFMAKALESAGTELPLLSVSPLTQSSPFLLVKEVVLVPFYRFRVVIVHLLECHSQSDLPEASGFSGQ